MPSLSVLGISYCFSSSDHLVLHRPTQGIIKITWVFRLVTCGVTGSFIMLSVIILSANLCHLSSLEVSCLPLCLFCSICGRLLNIPAGASFLEVLYINTSTLLGSLIINLHALGLLLIISFVTSCSVEYHRYPEVSTILGNICC